MKKNNMYKVSFIVSGLFFFLFLGIGLSVLLTGLLSHLQNVDVLNNGQQVKATIVAFDTNLSINDESYYYFEVSYINDQGHENKAKTPSMFTFDEVLEYTVDKVIVVKHMNGNKVVPLEYHKNPSLTFSLIFGSIFAFFGFVSGMIFIITCVNKQKAKKIERYGIETLANIVRVRGGVYINNEQYFSIILSVKTVDYEVFNCKTPHLYRQWEVEYFMSLPRVRIKYYGKKAIITQEYEKPTLMEESDIWN